MRVLVVHNRYRSGQPSGENSVVDDEKRLLEGQGVEVVSLEMRSDDIETWPLAKKMALPFRVVWSAEGYRATKDAIRRARPSVVHFHNTFPLLSPASLWAAHRAAVPVVHTLHNFRPLCPAGTFFRDGRICEECLGHVPVPAVRHGTYRDSRTATIPVATMDAVHRAAKTWARCVDRFITPSHFAREKYVQAGWPPEKLVVKPNTAPDGGPREGSSSDDFVCLSRLVPEKGVGVLLDAWRIAAPDLAGDLVVAGSGPLERSLKERASDVPRIRFTGELERSEAVRLVRSARALVLPSRWYEVFPRTVVEAYSLGVPVVASRLGALAEVVRDGETGLLFEPDSPASLAGALRALGHDRGRADELGRRARVAFERSFHPEKTTARLLSIYHDAETARRRGRRGVDER